ncbi:hypothetical protein [Nonomuraea rubra]|uniref:hypothetical protein n=1 Tax=Nonomuraea rubra TaxID=46180 RepID=UPI0031EBAEB6
MFATGTLVLAISPATVSAPVVWAEVPVLVIGLAVMLAANALLLRRSLAPLDALTTLMQRVDLFAYRRPPVRERQQRPHPPDRHVQRDAGPAGGRAQCQQRPTRWPRRRASGSASPASCTTRSARA